MCYILWKARSQSRTPRTINLLSRLIALSIETGLATTVSGAAGLVFVEVVRNTALYVVPMFMLSKLYSNSLLVVCIRLSRHPIHILNAFMQVLNSRIRIVGGRGSADATFMSELIITNPESNPTHSTPALVSTQIHRQVEIQVGISPSWEAPSNIKDSKFTPDTPLSV